MTHTFAVRNLRLTALAAALLLSGQVWAVGDGTIVDGAGGIVKNGATTTVTQTSDKLIVNWDDMDVAKRETLAFSQPDASSAVLNRIDSGAPTNILGAVNANGRVFIVNPNGVTIGNGAKINVGSLVASSLNIQDEAFKADRLDFAGGQGGSVVNRGSITAAEAVALIGARVENHGSIKSQGGNALLAAAASISLAYDEYGLEATLNESGLEALVDNRGLIATQNGDIVLTAWARDALARSVINNSGVIEAARLDDGASIDLVSLGDGEVSVGGTLRTAGKARSNGSISVLGRGIDVRDGAKLGTVKGSGLIQLVAMAEGEAAGYVKFGKASIVGRTLEIEADNILTSTAQDQLPSIDARVELQASQGDLSRTLGRELQADEAARLHEGSGSVSAGFVKAASKRHLLVEAGGSGSLATQGRLDFGTLELQADRGEVKLDGELSGSSLGVRGANVTLAGTTRAKVLTAIAEDSLALDGHIDATRLILHANEHAATSDGASLRARDATLSGGSFDLTRGDIALTKLDLDLQTADLALNGNTNVRSAQVEGDLRLAGSKNLRLDDVDVGGALDVAAAGTVSLGQVESQGGASIRERVAQASHSLD